MVSFLPSLNFGGLNCFLKLIIIIIKVVVFVLGRSFQGLRQRQYLWYLSKIIILPHFNSTRLHLKRNALTQNILLLWNGIHQWIPYCRLIVIILILIWSGSGRFLLVFILWPRYRSWIVGDTLGIQPRTLTMRTVFNLLLFTLIIVSRAIGIMYLLADFHLFSLTFCNVCCIVSPIPALLILLAAGPGILPISWILQVRSSRSCWLNITSVGLCLIFWVYEAIEELVLVV